MKHMIVGSQYVVQKCIVLSPVVLLKYLIGLPLVARFYLPFSRPGLLTSRFRVSIRRLCFYLIRDLFC